MKILVIHATAGAGHKKAAEAIFQGLRLQGRHEAVLVDALDHTNPFFKKTYPGVYSFLVTRLPWVWGVIFRTLEIVPLPVLRLVRRLYNGLNAQALQQFLVQEQFDAIITTQFFSAEVASYLKRTGKINSRIICVVTDFDVHPIWINDGTDQYCVACEHTKDKMISLGIASEKVFVTGIPTDSKFAQNSNRTELRTKLGLHDRTMIILIATGSFGMGPIEALAKLLQGYQLLIVCGHNKALYQQLGPLATGDTHVMGLVDNMDELMSVADVMVTKPGGLSISEALVKKLPMIFFSAIPGQELNNLKVLRHAKISSGQSSLPQIVKTVHEWDSRPELLDEIRLRMDTLSKPNAVRDIILILK